MVNILTITQGVRKIKPREYAGNECEAIAFPEGVEEIGDEAFAECSELKYLRIPDGVKKIGTGAFRDCNSLVDVFIPKSVEEIGENAFTHFSLIYCEVLERPEGWIYQWEELLPECPDEVDKEGEESNDISDEIVENQRVRSWCGSFEIHLTFDEFIVEGKHFELDMERKVIWWRDWDCFVVDEDTGSWYFDQMAFLYSLGEEWLNKGMVPNCNRIAKELREEIRTKMENSYSSNDSIGDSIQQYVELIVSNYKYPEHAGEFLFEMWSIYQYARQLAGLSSMPKLRQAWIRPLTMEMEKYSDMLEDVVGERWKDIRDRLENIDIRKTDFALLVKKYYESGEQELEDRIFDKLDEKYFSVERTGEDAKRGKELYEQAVELIKEKNYEEAGVLFEKSAKLGDVGGQYNYGVTLMNGEGCEKNPLEAAYWYRKAAMRGHSRAMVNLAICYRNGWGVLKSGSRMLYWYVKAAYELEPEGVYQFGQYLNSGTELTKGAGQTLIHAADELDQEDVAAFVKKVSKMWIEELEKQMYHGENCNDE